MVDENDVPRGTMEKQEAHLKGELHRAFSIFIFNSKEEVLLQKRATSKYHSGGLWTNACCSHPAPDEEMQSAIHSRLKEEIGVECELKELFQYTYKATFDNGLTEHELDHVFVGYTDAHPILNQEEAESWKYMGKQEVLKEIKEYPGDYTVWFKLIYPEVLKAIK